ncbi:hypothetical protein ACFWQL_08755 [Amycolatopsis thermoflava]|uniref:hypothetical protein n=1 Tax=Amycolatopsis thermoflava TaxID=84480 RepID=UPI0036682AEA
MARRVKRGLEWLRWGCLAAAIGVLVVFLVAQGQTFDVSYGQSPTRTDPIREGEAGELTDTTVPSVAEMTALVAANPVTRLPGSIAQWDEQQVRAAIGATDVRILVAPPGLDEAERDRVRDVENANITIMGTQVTGDPGQVVADRLTGWRAQFAAGDVTDLLLFLIAHIQDRPEPPDADTIRYRQPTAAELEPVVADLRATGTHGMTDIPSAADAFPNGALFVVLPRQQAGQPIPDYGSALTSVFPGKPIVVMYGEWVEYHGPQAADFAEVAAAGFYGQYSDRLSLYAYPQRNILGAYLDRVTDVRYAGLFDRPLPYQPFDPVRVALPALPWIFAACAVVFLVLTARAVRTAAQRRPGASVRMAGLTALAIEVSGLTGDTTDPALTRAIATLQSAREAVAENLPDQHVAALLDDAEAELDHVAKTLKRREYRPAVYLRGRLA